jgi:hypothetical protein
VAVVNRVTEFRRRFCPDTIAIGLWLTGVVVLAAILWPK